MILNVEVAEVMPVNAYFYIDDESLHGFLIDPGAEPERLLRIIEEKNFAIEKILLTHGHFDHIGAVNEIQRKLKIPVIMYENGKNYAKNSSWNLSRFTLGIDLELDDVTFLSDKSLITLQNNFDFNVKLIHTPGHTTDGAIYYSEKDKVAFVGDTIFKSSFGRTDFPGGDFQTLMNTIKTKIFTLPEDTKLFTGHGEFTIVADEKNLFL